MKYKLLSVSKNDKIKEVNIGDYVQALASAQFYPQIDGFLDRDEDLKDYVGEPCAVIMNGWYMHNPQNWPPSGRIIPLYVAFHLNVLAKDELTSTKSINHLKQNSPIGCRDINTLNTLKDHGVDAYFSGCMTLTLGNTYRCEEKTGKTFMVDPPFNIKLKINSIIDGLTHAVLNIRDVSKLYREPALIFSSGKNFIKEFIKTSLFHKEYLRLFGRDIVMNSEYIHQQSKVYKYSFPTDELRLKEAERLIKEYSKAGLVITSRIHCALPCLGLGTPVLFVNSTDRNEADSCRLKGLLELFHVINCTNGKLQPTFASEIPITVNNVPQNMETWKPLSEKLTEVCKHFVSKIEKKHKS